MGENQITVCPRGTAVWINLTVVPSVAMVAARNAGVGGADAAVTGASMQPELTGLSVTAVHPRQVGSLGRIYIRSRINMFPITLWITPPY